jgi:hypothetical protein
MYHVTQLTLPLATEAKNEGNDSYNYNTFTCFAYNMFHSFFLSCMADFHVQYS